MGDMEQWREPVKGLTSEDVWAMFRETDRQMQETALQMRETDREWKETCRFLEGLIAKTDAQIKRTDKQIGELGNRFGELAEHLVTPNIVEKFRALGYPFTKAGPNLEFFGRNGKTLTEVDVWLENGEFAMAVEVKTDLHKQDVDHHARRMIILRRYFDERGDTRKLLGAVAGAIVKPEWRDYAMEKGFYVIGQSGDTVKIEVPEDFKPRIW
jgi:hypothetical protein